MKGSGEHALTLLPMNILICLFFMWSCYAVYMQYKLYGWSWWCIFLVAILNFILCPVCILIAIIRKKFMPIV
jgi:hypothetical protein